MLTSLFSRFNAGTVWIKETVMKAEPMLWKEHSAFQGVALKDLVPAESVGGGYSCHLVRIEPDMKIGLHTHPESDEMHLVLEGEGLCRTELGECVYTPGTVAIIPRAMRHEVLAGAMGLKLIAVFVTKAA